jgi:hypothetical protein
MDASTAAQRSRYNALMQMKCIDAGQVQVRWFELAGDMHGCLEGGLMHKGFGICW